MRTLVWIVAALFTLAVSPSEAEAEKVGVQSERNTGERIGVQSNRDTGQHLGLQKTVHDQGLLGLQTSERAVGEDVAEQLWDLNIGFDRDRIVIDSNAYKRLRAIAELLSEHPTVFIYVQGLAAKGEKDPDGLNLSERRAMLAITYLELFGVDRMVMELVIPGSAAEKRMTDQTVRHRTRHDARAGEAKLKPVAWTMSGVRFGVVEQH
jgi:outer membrane protein OmpA-like peptidoglycan-associated protein